MWTEWRTGKSRRTDDNTRLKDTQREGIEQWERTRAEGVWKGEAKEWIITYDLRTQREKE